MGFSFVRLACAASLLPAALAQIIARSEPEPVASAVAVDTLDFSDAAEVQTTTLKGINFGCKCYPGKRCWPSTNKWKTLNATVDGRLLVDIPPGAPCHNTFTGPLGTVNTYDAAKCAEATQNWESETWIVSQPAAELWTYFTNDTCRPTQNPTGSCTLGYYGVYVIMATKAQHVKAGIDFARRNNLRLIVRNTGHDFIGRSTGYGALIINTHSFQQIDWINSYRGPGSYRGGAVTLGAGVQGETILAQGHARNPPLVVVTGECPTLGIAGGFIQGGGHGPWTTLKGFSADNVLAFEAITASGLYVTANEWQNPDVATNNDGIIEAFKTVLSPRPDVFAFMIGHLFNPGYGAPKSNSATHPAWRNATNFVIAAMLVPVGSSLAQKADLQNLLTNTVDEALRDASTSGCTYVNEADPYQPNWQSHFWGSEYPKLRALRWKWDPLGVFYAISTPGTEGWEVIDDGTRLCRKL